MTRPLRVAVALSGGASLGAFQAGVVAALLVAAGSLRDHEERPWIVDGFGGGSAGALVALLAAAAALRDADPVEVLHDAWVEKVDTELLGAADGQAPLDFAGFVEAATGLFEDHGAGDHTDRASARSSPIVLHIALTGLRGLTYPVPGLRGDDSVRATTYVDWSRFRLQPGVELDDLFAADDRSPLAAALASAANPGAFAPRLLDRSHLTDEYRNRGVVDLPGTEALWYTDGALLQSEPVGRLLEALADLGDGDADDDRLVLLVDPRSEGPTSGDVWSEPGHSPHWLDGLQRALAILPAHVLYEDLRRIERDNARLAWVDEAVERLAPHLDDDAPLAEVLEDIEGDREERRPGVGAAAASDDGAATADLLRRLLERLAGLRHKQTVTVDVLSPLVLADEDQGAPTLLAGEILGDFGGFLDRDLRHSDFTLGYQTTTDWLDDALPALGYDAGTIETVTAAVDAAHGHHWEEVNRGGVEPGDLSWKVRRRALRLSGRFARALAGQVVGDALPWPTAVRGLLDRLRGR